MPHLLWGCTAFLTFPLIETGHTEGQDMHSSEISFLPNGYEENEASSYHVEVQGSLFYGTNSVPNGETFKSHRVTSCAYLFTLWCRLSQKKCMLELFFLLHKVKYSVNKK